MRWIFLKAILSKKRVRLTRSGLKWTVVTRQEWYTWKNKFKLAQFWHRLPICFSFDSLSVKFCLFLFPLWSLSEQRLLYFVRRGVIFFSLERRNLNWVGINIYRLRYTMENIYTHYSTFLCNSFYIHPHFNWRPRVTGYSSVGAQIRHLAYGEGVTHLNSKLSYS